MICLQYFHNIFITNFKCQIIGFFLEKLLLGPKSNLNIKFKFEPMITNHL